ncbi:MAG: hypothetical protein U0401_05005 [Anaerolineae bacterium]
MTTAKEYGKMRTLTGLSSDSSSDGGYLISDEIPDMKSKPGKSSWVAFALFYLVLIVIVTVLDWAKHLLEPRYWGTQVGLITLGVGIFAIVGWRLPDLSATRGVLLAFTVGILTIIPAVLMGLGQFPGFWIQYFSISLGMAAGSLLTFLFLRFSNRLTSSDKAGPDSNEPD